VPEKKKSTEAVTIIVLSFFYMGLHIALDYSLAAPPKQSREPIGDRKTSKRKKKKALPLRCFLAKKKKRKKKQRDSAHVLFMGHIVEREEKQKKR
jgi:hypothetical protein